MQANSTRTEELWKILSETHEGSNDATKTNDLSDQSEVKVLICQNFYDCMVVSNRNKHLLPYIYMYRSFQSWKKVNSIYVFLVIFLLILNFHAKSNNLIN